MTPFEVVVGGFIVTNTLVQLYDIVWCRWHHCGKSSKNSVEAKRAMVTPSEDYPTQSVGSLPSSLIKGNNG